MRQYVFSGAGTRVANLVNVQERMPRAYGHCLDHSSSFHRRILLCVDQIKHIYQRGPVIDLFFIRALEVCLCECAIILLALTPHITSPTWQLTDIDALLLGLLPPSSSPPLRFPLLSRLILSSRVFVQEEYRPVLRSHVRLIR